MQVDLFIFVIKLNFLLKLNYFPFYFCFYPKNTMMSGFLKSGGGLRVVCKTLSE